MNLREQILKLPKVDQITGASGVRHYKLASGVLAVSVTTALKVLDKPALIWWAASKERAHVTMAAEASFAELIRGTQRPSIEAFRSMMSVKLGQGKAHQRLAESARNIGTEAHSLIEWRLRRYLGESVGPEPRISDAAMVAVLKFESWARTVGLEPIAVEFPVWDERDKFAGTVDLLARLGDGRLVLIDWKTSSGIYIESTMQSAAYRIAASRLLGIKELTGLVVKLPKDIEKPEIEIKELGSQTLHSDFTAFRACLWLWNYLNPPKPVKPAAAPRSKKAVAPVPEAARWRRQLPAPRTIPPRIPG